MVDSEVVKSVGGAEVSTAEIRKTRTARLCALGVEFANLQSMGSSLV